jgi:hypothetical protein
MQDLKDTFYLMLRDRVAAGNASRTVVVRGVTRPGVVVVENELPSATAAGISVLDAFCMRWTGMSVDTRAWVPLTAMTCSITYATDGMAGNGGMDRGRLLAAMDAELSAALRAWPRFVPKLMAVAGQTTVGTADGTNVFWGDAVFGAEVMQNERLERTATVEVFGYGE